MSCDDACVALPDRFSKTEAPTIIATLDSKFMGAVVPTDAASHNRRSTSKLVGEVMRENGWNTNDAEIVRESTREATPKVDDAEVLTEF